MRRLSFLFLILSLLLLSRTVFSETGSRLSDKLSHLIPEEAQVDGKLGVSVNSLTADESIFRLNSDKLFVPASNMKIITSVAALSLLKNDYKWKTEFLSGGEITGGVLFGGLYVKGYGDPTLNTENLKSAADEFKKMGIKEVRGGIIVDDSYFDAQRYGKGWKEEWKGDAFSPPISALSLNYNTFGLNIRTTKLGEIPEVSLEPEGTNVNIINKAVTSNRKTIVARWLEDGKTIMLQGKISPRTPLYQFKLTVNNPTLYTGSALKKILEESGIKVQGFISVGQVPRWAKAFYTHFSAPLHSVISEFNKNSVNIIGENIIKTLGAEFKGTPGTWEKGALVVSEFLRKTGIKDGFDIADGSGLSPLNQVSPDTFVYILKHAYDNGVIALRFMSSLSVGGIDGTLKKRFRASAAAGKVIGKTGSLKNVSSLSGYVYTKTGDVLAFSVLANGPIWKAIEFQNKLVLELMECCEND